MNSSLLRAIRSVNEASEQLNMEKMESIFAADAVIIGGRPQFEGLAGYGVNVLNQVFQKPAALFL